MPAGEHRFCSFGILWSALLELQLCAGPHRRFILESIIAEHDVAPSMGSSQVFWFIVSAIQRYRLDMVKRRVSIIRRPGSGVGRKAAYLADIAIAVENKLSVLAVATHAALACRRRDRQRLRYSLSLLAFTASASIIPPILIQRILATRLVLLNKFSARLPGLARPGPVGAIADHASPQGSARSSPQDAAHVAAVVSALQMSLKLRPAPFADHLFPT